MKKVAVGEKVVVKGIEYYFDEENAKFYNKIVDWWEKQNHYSGPVTIRRIADDETRSILFHQLAEIIG